MGARLHDAPPVQNKDLVCVHHRRNPVADDEGGPSGQNRSEILKDFGLRVGVHRTERIIEDQDRGVPGDGPCQGGSLFLPSGKVDAPLAEDRGVSLGE